MEASHKTHRPHIKVGKDEEEEEEEVKMQLVMIAATEWFLYFNVVDKFFL